jgi:prepilin-type N-terminal cleavage/methylation domain-containing protein
MSSKKTHNAFTLVEVLVAMALIVTIVSMVYGSYFAASRSTDAARATLTSEEQARELLTQIARQIRCCYVGKDVALDRPESASVVGANVTKPTCYFYGDAADPTGQILRFVTTQAASVGKVSPAGLFEVAYKFDRNNGMLLYGQRRFVGASDKPPQHESFRPVAENADAVDLSFFDGESWVNRWRFEEQGGLPRAVRVEVILEDNNGRRREHMITAATNCFTSAGAAAREDRGIVDRRSR